MSGRRGYRVPLPWHALAISDGAHGVAAQRPRLIVRRTGSSSRLRIAPLQSSSRSRLPGLLEPGASRGVFFPLRDINRAQLLRGSHSPQFRPRRFTRPRRLAPPSALRVYFAPLPRPGFSLQGFSLPRSRTASSAAVPSRRCRPLAARGCPLAPPAAGPSSGPCSARESVFAIDGV